ncbi:MAG: type I restriction enzyme HsdR N-terminal domain-containing protein [Muribaculaceae bacterium]|nr:type I restriction enzyme HsdR N-terminal domain-containing protein [Muribaculaceae bacterium]
MNPPLFTPLNLPPGELRLGRDGSGRVTVWDVLRRKWVVLTPEEWVRQHMVRHLINDLGYPMHLMANEVGLRLNGRSRRCDTIVWRAGRPEPLLVVEFKAPSVAITQRTLEQAARYNMVLGARALLLSNGLTHFCCSAGGGVLEGIPAYSELSAFGG